MRQVCVEKIEWNTVKLCYNGHAYNVSSVLAYASSRSRHFSIQNVSISMYLDITYPRLIRTDFWAQTLQRTPASTHIRKLLLMLARFPLHRRFTREPAPTSLHSTYAQSRKQPAVSITLI